MKYPNSPLLLFRILCEIVVCIAITSLSALGQYSGSEECNAQELSNAGKWENISVGYDRGFFISQSSFDVDPGDAEFLLRVNGWAHLRHTYFNAEGIHGDENQFEFERARLVFRGNAWSPDFQYVLQIDGDNDQATQVDLLDYYVTYDFGHSLLGKQNNALRLRAGQWKVPFNRARQLSGRELSFAERGLASVFFDINRSVGVGLLGEAAVFQLPFRWDVALHNGFKSSAKRPAIQGGLDDNVAVSGRVSLDPIGSWDEDGISDLVWHESVAVRLGGGFAVTTFDLLEGGEATSLFAVDGGESFQSLFPAPVTQFRSSLFSLDAGLRLRGLSVFAEYYFRITDDFRGLALPRLADDGFVSQAGYFIVPERLEALVRWSRVTGDSSTLGQGRQSADEIATGLGYYINGRNNKIVFDVSHINGAPIRESRLNYQPGDVGWTFRTQLQFGF